MKSTIHVTCTGKVTMDIFLDFGSLSCGIYKMAHFHSFLCVRNFYDGSFREHYLTNCLLSQGWRHFLELGQPTSSSFPCAAIALSSLLFRYSRSFASHWARNRAIGDGKSTSLKALVSGDSLRYQTKGLELDYQILKFMLHLARLKHIAILGVLGILVGLSLRLW